MYTSNNNKHMITLNKENSSTYAEINHFRNDYRPYWAAIQQGEGFNRATLAMKQFKTEAGARRWVAKEFAI